MAVGSVAPVHLAGEHSFWAWSWTSSRDAFILYAQRICVENDHTDIDWECSDCCLPADKEHRLFRMIRDSLREENDDDIRGLMGQGFAEHLGIALRDDIAGDEA